MDSSFFLLEFGLSTVYDYPMTRYKHVLALNPYFAHTTAIMHLFPPTGLE